MVTNTIRRAAAVLFLMVCMTLSAGVTVHAADTLLFNVLLNDGYSVKTIPVYQEADGKIKAQKEYRTVYVNRASTAVTFKIKGKTAYFKSNFKKITVPKSVAVGTDVKAKFRVSDPQGNKKTFKIKIKKPAKPKIDSVVLGKTTYTPGTGNLNITVNTTVQEEVTCLYKVYNSKGKLVFSYTIGTGTGPVFKSYWDGTAKDGNKAGIKAGAYAPAGKYKIKVYLAYKNGNATKKVKKTETVTLKEAQVQAAAPAEVPVFTKTWDWTVILTGNKKADYLAEVICQEILKPGMTEYKRAKAIYKWCAQHFQRTGRGSGITVSNTAYKIDISSAEAKKAIKAYRKKTKAMIAAGTAVVNNKNAQAPEGGGTSWYNKRIQGMGKQVGDCTQAAAMFECLCRHAGLECDIIENSLPLTNQLHHVWNVVKVDGVWYYSDSRLENSINATNGTKKVKYRFFLKGKKVMAKWQKRYGMIRNKASYKKLYKLCSNTDYVKA